MVCTFFGNRDITDNISEKIEKIILFLIEEKNVRLFYVGKEGKFDYLVRQKLKEIKEKYSYVNYLVVLAYLPVKNNEDYTDTVFPEEIERVPYRFRISKRNVWMIEKSDYIVTYIKYTTGGAFKAMEYAEKKGKKIYKL